MTESSKVYFTSLGCLLSFSNFSSSRWIPGQLWTPVTGSWTSAVTLVCLCVRREPGGRGYPGMVVLAAAGLDLLAAEVPVAFTRATVCRTLI